MPRSASNGSSMNNAVPSTRDPRPHHRPLTPRTDDTRSVLRRLRIVGSKPGPELNRSKHAGGIRFRKQKPYHIGCGKQDSISYTESWKDGCLDNPRSEIENKRRSKARMRTYSPEDAAQAPLPIPQLSSSMPSPSSLAPSTQDYIPHSRRVSRVPTHRSAQVDSGRRS